MPQMAPTWWTYMYIIFTLSLILTMIHLYFQKYNNPPHNKLKMNYSHMDWTW